MLFDDRPSAMLHQLSLLMTMTVIAELGRHMLIGGQEMEHAAQAFHSLYYPFGDWIERIYKLNHIIKITVFHSIGFSSVWVITTPVP